MTEMAIEHTPDPGSTPDIPAIVAADIKARYGYGHEDEPCIPPHNGLDALNEAYEQSLYTAICLRQMIEERESVGEGDTIDAVLRAHYITGIRHNNQLHERVLCLCGTELSWHETTAEAVGAWIGHIKAEIAAGTRP